MGNDNFRLTYIEPLKVRDVWETIKPGLVAVKNHSGDSWMVEDIWTALTGNQSSLFVGYLNDEYKGFLVLTPCTGYDGPYLHIWACYSNAHDVDVMKEGMEEIKRIANRLNAKRITFYSPRKGWERNQYGFKPRTTQFAMEV